LVVSIKVISNCYKDPMTYNRIASWTNQTIMQTKMYYFCTLYLAFIQM